MNIQEKVHEILRDLYTLDPAFKKHETRLIQIISQLLATKPEVTVDAAFADNLRKKLAAHAETETATTPKRTWAYRLNFALGAIALVAIVASSVLYRQANAPSNYESAIARINQANTITNTTPRAFGSLTNLNAGGIGGGGTGGAGREAMSAAPEQPVDTKVIAPDTMPPIVQYSFVYKGEKIELTNNELPVYKRIKNAYPELQQSLLSRLNLKNFGFNNFSNPQMESVAFHDDKEFGYTATIDFISGSLSLSQNWTRWPNDYVECNYNQDCIKQRHGTTAPSDQEIIDIANNFFKEQNISLAEYGAPEVQEGWRQMFESSRDTDAMFMPEMVSVVYPRKIKNETVRDEGGNAAGIVVNVSLWQKRVAGLFDYGPLRLEESAYTMETDADRILKFATSQGYTGGDMPNSTKATVELGTPTLGLVRSWLQGPNDISGNEVYTPALIFPATSKDAKHPYYSKYVVVPLAKEILDDREKQQQQPPITIMEKAQ